ncbi:hypothetical protein BDDG_00977 [Blastomyces dermatitidis ATCC 18188]|uniref:Uncharacterized protein n=1 Tax=Ajellomyces dermatitidis (strain ATCC 18188 / CBS 674.68) TaxID=653446 RepID=F2T3N8_AJEDA|nr:hypothetical protein BDDG_00977 [Blastomyces dermatitidis ATCC 18188]
MATLIPISIPSQSTKKGQLEQQPDGGWNSWTPEEQGGVLAASILLFLFFFALALVICLRVPSWDRERRAVDTERGMRERRERRERHRRRRRQRREGGLSSVARAMPVPQPRQNRNICTSAVRESGGQRATRRFSSDERHRRELDGHGMGRRESTGRSHCRDSRERRAPQRRHSCPTARDRVPTERRTGPSGERSHWDRRQPPRESMLVCDGSDETLERKIESDSTDSYADGDPGPSTRKGKEPVRNQHKRHRSEGMVRIERGPRHMRSYSVE